MSFFLLAGRDQLFLDVTVARLVLMALVLRAVLIVIVTVLAPCLMLAINNPDSVNAENVESPEDNVINVNLDFGPSPIVELARYKI